MAERLAEAIRTAPYASAGLQIRCTMSAGVAHAAATSPEEATVAVRQALREADLAMYAAKRAGRDRVISFRDLSTRDVDLTVPAAGGGGGAAVSGDGAVAAGPQDDPSSQRAGTPPVIDISQLDAARSGRRQHP